MKDLQVIIDRYQSEADQFPSDSLRQFRSKVVSRGIEMMSKAEEFFGPRDLSFTIDNISFEKTADGKAPFSALSGENSRTIYLGVPDENREETSMRLAHELTHCLAPNRAGAYTVLEEGCACAMGCYFGEGRWMPGEWEISHQHLAHIRRIKPDVIKEIRAKLLAVGKGSGFSEIEIADLAVSIKDETEILENLTTTFDPGRGKDFFPHKNQYVI